jgi:hypothetical protein
VLSIKAGTVSSALLLRKLGTYSRLPARLDSLGLLKSGVAVAEATDIVTLLTNSETYSKLVGRYGWTYDRAEA